MIADIQRELAALPVELRARTRERIIRMLHEQISAYDRGYEVLELICEAGWIEKHLTPAQAIVELTAIVEKLDTLDPDFGVREAFRWLRVLLQDNRTENPTTVCA